MTKYVRLTHLLFATLALPLSACYVESGPPHAHHPGQAESVEVVETPPAPPPAPAPETVPPAPSNDHIWVAGYQRWNGRGYAWEKGHYEPRPRASAKHVPGHWEARGRGHVWVDAHWE